MEPNEKREATESEKRLAAIVVRLSARISAQNVMLMVLAHRFGLDMGRFRTTSRQVFQAVYHKELSRLENRNPALAAELDAETDWKDLDPELIDMLRWDDEDHQ